MIDRCKVFIAASVGARAATREFGMSYRAWAQKRPRESAAREKTEKRVQKRRREGAYEVLNGRSMIGRKKGGYGA